MKQKGFANIILIISITILIGVSGYFTFVKKIRTDSQKNAPSQSLTPSPTSVSDDRPFAPSVSDETVNWETYKDEKYGFEIKYPPQWKYIRNPDIYKLSLVYAVPLFSFESVLGYEVNFNLFNTYFAFEKARIKTADEYKKSYLLGTPEVKFKEISIGDKSAIEAGAIHCATGLCSLEVDFYANEFSSNISPSKGFAFNLNITEIDRQDFPLPAISTDTSFDPYPLFNADVEQARKVLKTFRFVD